MKALLPLRLLLVGSLLLTVTACSTISGWFESDDDDAKEPAPLVDIISEINVKRLWSSGVGNGQGKGLYQLRPAISGSLIYAASNDGDVVVLDRMTGKRQWRVDVEYPLSGGVGVGSGMVLLGSSDGDVIALSAEDGSQLWQTTVRGEVLSPPQTNGSIVLVQSYDGRLQALDVEDGSELWVYDSNLPVLTLRGTSAPMIFEKFAIAAFGNGKVIAFDVQTGAVRWEARVAIAQGRSEIDRIVDIDGSMVLIGGNLYAVSYQGRVAAIEVSSGRKLWQEDVSSYVGVDQGFGNVYVSEEGGSVIAYYRNGRGVRWEQPALENRRLGAPRAIKGNVAVADFQGYVHFLSQVDGSFTGRTKVDGSGIRADMLAMDDVLYVFGNGGKLVALRISNKGS